MKIELEIGMNLRGAIETFCRIHGSDTDSLGTEISAAFGLNFGDIADSLIKSYSNSKLEEIIIKVK